ncbi:hypothetical protein ABPG72_005300 [Tetrahymena utriculariae]
MNFQQTQPVLNNIINLFLDIASKEIPHKELIIETEQSSKSGSSSLNQLYLKNNQDYICESIQYQEKSIKQYDFFDSFEEKAESKTKHNQQQNIIKNILKSFLSYLIKLQDNNIKQKYQQMNSKQTNVPFSEIKKAVSKKVNIKANRWNFQLRSIVHSKSLKNIFYDYLVNQSKQWLQQSKVSNLYDHQRLIDVLLNCIKNNYPLEIKTYKKKK